MEENRFSCLKNFSCIQFENREFYVPVVSCDIYIQAHLLQIFLWDHDKYVLANGLKCYYSLIYNAQEDTISTTLKNATIDGIPITPKGLSCTSIPYDAEEFQWSEQHPMTVVLKRDFTELSNAFLEEAPHLDNTLKRFLLEHPESYSTYWPERQMNMNRNQWLIVDGDIKTARENPEFKQGLLDNIPLYPSRIHNVILEALDVKK